MKINTISPQDNNYLQIINTIALVPRKLHYIGYLPQHRLPTVAIVGTRKPTRYGIEVTHMLATDLAKKGVVIISGMALGIDAIAHKAAIEAGGTTIAVQANGLSRLYPATNRQLGEDIVRKGGAIISEYDPDTSARKHQFHERNRIVSGLADAVLITEASARSGTLNTARHALEQGKDIFVIPGNITSSQSAGCNQLLRQGATPVTCVNDILEVIAPDLITSQASLPLGDNPLQSKILELLQAGVRDGDDLLRQCDVTAGEFATELTMMEIAGHIRALGANQWALSNS